MKKGMRQGRASELTPRYRAILSAFLSAFILSCCTLVVFATVSAVNTRFFQVQHEKTSTLLVEDIAITATEESPAPIQAEQPSEVLPEDREGDESCIANYELAIPERDTLVATLDTLLEEEDCLKVNSLIRGLLAQRDENKSTSSVESVHRSPGAAFPVTRHSVFLNSPQSLPALRSTLEDHLGSSCVIEESRLSKKRQLIQIYQYDMLCAEVLCIENYDPLPEGEVTEETEQQKEPYIVLGDGEREKELPVEDPISEVIPQETESVPESMDEDPSSYLEELVLEDTTPVEESPVEEEEEPEPLPEPREEAVQAEEGEAVEEVVVIQEGEEPQEEAVEGETVLPEEDSAEVEVETETEAEEIEEDPQPVTTPVVAEASEAKLAIIIDDGGYFKEESERILALDYPLTLAILPDTPLGEYVASEGHARGFEIILHMPMQSSNGRKNHFPGELGVAMSREAIQERTRECLAMYPQIVGVNNHTGGLFTSCCEQMGHFLDVVREEGKYFVDSVTTAKSCAFVTAIEKQVPCAKRDIFIDHDNQLSQVRHYFHRAVAHAKQHGSCIAIGHFRKNTVAVLEEELPLLKNKGVRIVPISELVW